MKDAQCEERDKENQINFPIDNCKREMMSLFVNKAIQIITLVFTFNITSNKYDFSIYPRCMLYLMKKIIKLLATWQTNHKIELKYSNIVI